MVLIDFILNLAALLLWLSGMSLRFDPLVRTSPSSLIGTLKRTDNTRLKGWPFWSGLALLLVLRALVYWVIGSSVEWTPRLNLVWVVPAFPLRNHDLWPVLLFSVLSFLRVLSVFYFWTLALVIINRPSVEPDPVQRLARLHLGPIARWPWPIQVVLPVVAVTGLWLTVQPLLARLNLTYPVSSLEHLVQQGLLLSLALALTLKYLLPLFLLLYLVATYVYLGSSPFWDFVTTTARNLLTPLRRLPLRAGKLDLAPLAGVILILLALDWLPNSLIRQMARHHLWLWPQ